MKISLSNSGRLASRTQSNGKPSMKTWPPDDAEVYCKALEEFVGDIKLENSLASKCEQIEDALRQAMSISITTFAKEPDSERTSTLSVLFAQRKSLASSQTAERACISKENKSEIQANRRRTNLSTRFGRWLQGCTHMGF